MQGTLTGNSQKQENEFSKHGKMFNLTINQRQKIKTVRHQL